MRRITICSTLFNRDIPNLIFNMPVINVIAKTEQKLDLRYPELLVRFVNIVEDDISAVSTAPSHFRQVLARTKTTALPRARVRALLLADPDVLGSLAL